MGARILWMCVRIVRTAKARKLRVLVAGPDTLGIAPDTPDITAFLCVEKKNDHCR